MKRNQTPVVALRLLRCPRCRSQSIKNTGTKENTPERKVHRRRCLTCGLAFVSIAD